MQKRACRKAETRLCYHHSAGENIGNCVPKVLVSHFMCLLLLFERLLTVRYWLLALVFSSIERGSSWVKDNQEKIPAKYRCYSSYIIQFSMTKYRITVALTGYARFLWLTKVINTHSALLSKQ